MRQDRPRPAARTGRAIRLRGATGVGAVVNTAKVEPGQSVAVVGLGGVGLSVVLGARLAGARQIVAVDLSDEKLAFATRLGATQTVNARSNDAVGEIRRMSGNGVDVAFEMAGSVPALELAYAVTARGGATVTAGLPHPDKRMNLCRWLSSPKNGRSRAPTSARPLRSATCRA